MCHCHAQLLGSRCTHYGMITSANACGAKNVAHAATLNAERGVLSFFTSLDINLSNSGQESLQFRTGLADSVRKRGPAAPRRITIDSGLKIAPTDGIETANWKKRRLRNVAVFWAAPSQADLLDRTWTSYCFGPNAQRCIGSPCRFTNVWNSSALPREAGTGRCLKWAISRTHALQQDVGVAPSACSRS
jgi:hypothetical protein